MQVALDFLTNISKFLEAEGQDAQSFLLWLWNETIPQEQFSTLLSELEEHPLTALVEYQFSRIYGINPFYGMI